MKIEELVIRAGDEVLYLNPRDRLVIRRDRPTEDVIVRVTHQVYGPGKERIPSA